MHPNSGPRRRHSAELKAKVLAACAESGASISGVALAHGLNTNLVRKWRSGRGTKRGDTTITPAATGAALAGVASEFVAVEMPALPRPAAAVQPRGTVPITDSVIHIELRRGPVHLNVRWPTTAAANCQAWLRELASGLLK